MRKVFLQILTLICDLDAMMPYIRDHELAELFNSTFNHVGMVFELDCIYHLETTVSVSFYINTLGLISNVLRFCVIQIFAFYKITFLSLFLMGYLSRSIFC